MEQHTKELYERLQTLTILRPLLQEPLLQSFSTMMESMLSLAEGNKTALSAAVSAYCDFTSEIYRCYAENEREISGNFSCGLYGLLFRTETDYLKAKARKKEFVETIMGRRRYLRDINSRNAVVRGMAERNAINAPIQGSAADIIKMAMICIQKRIQEEGLMSRMIIQVHDELNFKCHKSEQYLLKSLVTNCMEHVIKLSVPLTVSTGFGNNWYEAH